MNGSDYYDILGVSKDATDKEIKSAFRKKASENHPDKNKDPKASENFKKVNEAYQILSSPEKRKAYDQYGSAAFANGGGGAGFDPNGMQFDFSDMFGGGFDSIFGDSNPFADIFGGGRRSSQQSNVGGEVHLRITISLEDVILAPEKTIRYNRKERCATCNGQGGAKVEECKNCKGSGRVAQMTRSILGNMQVVRECNECHGSGKKILEKCKVCHGESTVEASKELKIRIPKGIDSGLSLRFRNEGNAGKFGGEYGDLFIEIQVQNDKRFIREGDDLYMELRLPLYSLVLGDEKIISTFDGDKKVKIPAGMQVGERLSLRELGIPNMRTQKRGNIIIMIKADVPKSVKKEEKELYERLKDLSENKGKK
jgi:molecular chaperone DnaJ